MVLLILSFYSFLDGIKDAIFYYLKNPEKKLKYNEHIFFFIMRFLFGMIICLYLEEPTTIVNFGLVFSYIHNGVYYTTREIIKKGTYPKYWYDHSSTSTAKTTKLLTPEIREFLFVIGIYTYLI